MNHICKNCGKEFEGKFCPECGTPAENTNNEYTDMEPVDITASTNRTSSTSANYGKKPHGRFKTVLIVLGALLVIGIIGSSSSVLYH